MEGLGDPKVDRIDRSNPQFPVYPKKASSGQPPSVNQLDATPIQAGPWHLDPPSICCCLPDLKLEISFRLEPITCYHFWVTLIGSKVSKNLECHSPLAENPDLKGKHPREKAKHSLQSTWTRGNWRKPTIFWTPPSLLGG